MCVGHLDLQQLCCNHPPKRNLERQDANGHFGLLYQRNQQHDLVQPYHLKLQVWLQSLLFVNYQEASFVTEMIAFAVKQMKEACTGFKKLPL